MKSFTNPLLLMIAVILVSGAADALSVRTATTVFSGEPTARARTLRHRQIIQDHPVYDIEGTVTTPESKIIVFMRSLG